MTKKNGKPCKRCGTSDWYSGGGCKQCAREASRKYRENNPDKVREAGRKYRENNPDKVRRRTRKWQKNNPDKVREASRKHRDENPEYNRRWQENNPGKHYEYVRKWQENNPDKVKAMVNRRRTRETQAGGSFTSAEWNGLCEAYKNMCLKCRKTLPRNKLTADHIKPVSHGGDSNITNIQPLCKPCNSSKGAKHIDYREGDVVDMWMQDRLL